MHRSAILIFFTIVMVIVSLASCKQSLLQDESSKDSLLSYIGTSEYNPYATITVTINQEAAQTDPDNTLPVTFSIVFSDAIDPATFDETDINQTGTASGVAWTAPTTTDNITWIVEVFTATGDGTIVPTIAAGAAQDLLGNTNASSTSTDNSVTYDTTSPMATVIQASGQIDPTETAPVNFTIVFNEEIDPATFSTSDISSSGTVTGMTWQLTTTDNITWNLAATVIPTSGTLVPTVAVSTVQDLAGNSNTVTTVADNSVMYDNAAPAITTFANAGPAPTTSQVVPLTVAATDGNGIGITGWMITTTATAPAAADPNWLGAAPSSYLLKAIPAVHTLYLWVKDGLDHVSTGTSLSVQYQLPTYSAKVLQTGQTNCYDETGTAVACSGSGQDGEFLKGLGWTSPRFTDNGNGTITDNSTGLIWTADLNMISSTYPSLDNDGTAGDGRVYWQTALNFAAQLNTDSYATRTDWRLPNIVELMSLMNYGTGIMSTWLATYGFTNAPSFNKLYWSSTTYRAISTGTIAWSFDFAMGQKNDNTDKASYVCHALAVAGTTSILPQTGQTQCWNSSGVEIDCSTSKSQDGAHMAGVSLPSPRFTHNGDGTTTDNLTGLMWTTDKNVMVTDYDGYDSDQTADDGAVYWEHALAFIDQLNADIYAGYSDWRLPNINELLSVYQHELSFGEIMAEGFIHPSVQTCWSSTTNEGTYTGDTSYAFLNNVLYGNDGIWGKTGDPNDDRNVWPVRGN